MAESMETKAPSEEVQLSPEAIHFKREAKRLYREAKNATYMAVMIGFISTLAFYWLVVLTVGTAGVDVPIWVSLGVTILLLVAQYYVYQAYKPRPIQPPPPHGK